MNKAFLPNTIYRGKISWFGGINDTGVALMEGLALYEDHEADERTDLFLMKNPMESLGLARRLRPEAYYCAGRWDYSVTPKSVLRNAKVEIWKVDGIAVSVEPVDWGPAVWTQRILDVSPATMVALNAKTDDEVYCRLIIAEK